MKEFIFIHLKIQVFIGETMEFIPIDEFFSNQKMTAFTVHPNVSMTSSSKTFSK